MLPHHCHHPELQRSLRESFKTEKISALKKIKLLKAKNAQHDKEKRMKTKHKEIDDQLRTPKDNNAKKS